MQQYFKRIACTELLAGDLESLKLLHYQHSIADTFREPEPLAGLPSGSQKHPTAEGWYYNGAGGYCFDTTLLRGHVLATSALVSADWPLACVDAATRHCSSQDAWCCWQP